MQIASTGEKIAAIKERLLQGEKPVSIVADINCSKRLVGVVKERIILEKRRWECEQ
jgi:hypothetical protein